MNKKIAVLVSGTGRHLQNFIDKSQDLSIDIVLVVSSSSQALALEKARGADIPCYVRGKKGKEVAEHYSQDIFTKIREARADLVCLAGFLKLLYIPSDFENRVINIHPSLIPDFCGRGFYGSRVHRAVSEAGVSRTGCTVHYCDNLYDHGPIILQKSIKIEPGLNPDMISKKVFELEIEAYPEAVKKVLTKFL